MEQASRAGSISRSSFYAPAKVNLFLKVLSKRPDGYHEIESLMQPVSLYDEILIETGRGGIEVVSDKVPGGKDNLAYRAAETFYRRAGLTPSVSIEITKKIPVGAGLGGGSSDAATVLMALNEICSAGLSEKDLMELGAGLGSDVPFFILKGPALAKGRGEVLARAELPGLYYVLINPGFHVSTAWVYGNLDLTKRAEDNNLTYSKEALSDVKRIKGLLYNDLEAVTVKRHPEIAALKAALIEAGAQGSLMSGSGPTVFGIFTGEDAARLALGSLRQRFGPDYFLAAVRGL